MASTLKPCCEDTLRRFRRRMLKSCVSFPVIKQIPCPVCNEIVKLRIYEPPANNEDEAA